MVIGGFQKVSLSDFPGVIASIVFTRGCTFRCPYCHNPELVIPARYAAEIPFDEVMGYLRSRRGRVEGVVVTGGEPTVHSDLPEFLAALRSAGLKLKLDTNGSNPPMLRQIFADRLLDFVAMDVKAPLGSYGLVTGVAVDTSSIRQSIELVLGSGVPQEFRTTVGGAALALRDLPAVGELVRGCRQFVVQAFRPGKTLEPGVSGSGEIPPSALGELAARLTASGIPTTVR